MLRSFVSLRHVNPGFESSNVLSLRLSLPEVEHPGADGASSYFASVLERILALPGVESADGVTKLPLTGGGSVRPRVVEIIAVAR